MHPSPASRPVSPCPPLAPNLSHPLPMTCSRACMHMEVPACALPWCCRCCMSGSCFLLPASPSARWPAASPDQPRGSGWWLSRPGHPHQGTVGHLERGGCDRVTRALTSIFPGGLAQLKGSALCPTWIPPWARALRIQPPQTSQGTPSGPGQDQHEWAWASVQVCVSPQC